MLDDSAVSNNPYDKKKTGSTAHKELTKPGSSKKRSDKQCQRLNRAAD